MRLVTGTFGKFYVHDAANTCIAALFPAMLFVLCCGMFGLRGTALAETPQTWIYTNSVNKAYEPATNYAPPGAVAGLVCVISIRTPGIRQIIFRFWYSAALGLAALAVLLHLLFCALWRFLGRCYIKIGLRKESPLAINLGGHAPPFG